MSNCFITGIDYSITSPAASMLYVEDFEEYRFDIKKLQFISFIEKKVKYKKPDFVVQNDFKWNNFVQRWNNILNHFINNMRFNFPYKLINYIAIEGYAYTPSGLITQIAENTGLLKYKLWDNSDIDLNRFKIYQPKSVKQFITGNGNANKVDMYNEICKKFDINLSKFLGIPENEIPIFDITDSIAICYMLYVEMCVRNGKEKWFTTREVEYLKKENKQGYSILEDKFIYKE